ncbi:MAG: hypothetical protein AAGC95_10490 [Pseudomonadota bacterium]
MRVLSIGLLVAGLAVSGCANTPPATTSERGISLPYDLWDYNPVALDAEARRHCEGFGRSAKYVSETTEGKSVRWRYRHYECV